MVDPSVPKQYELLGPTIEALLALGGSAAIHAINKKVIEQQSYSPRQLAALHGVGKGTELAYQLAWARTILHKIGAVTNPRRGVWAVTEYGQNATDSQLVDAS